MDERDFDTKERGNDNSFDAIETDRFDTKSSTYYENDNFSGYDYEANYNKRNPVFGIIALACGIVSLVLGCICCCIFPLAGIPFQIIFGIAGVVMFIIDKKKNGSASALSIVGLVTSIVSITIALLFAILYIIYFIIYLTLGVGTMMAPSLFGL